MQKKNKKDEICVMSINYVREVYNFNTEDLCWLPI